MPEAYSRRDFLTGVLLCGTLTSAALALLHKNRPLQPTIQYVELKLVTGDDPTGARDLLINMWNKANPQTQVKKTFDTGATLDQKTTMQTAAANGTADILNLDTIHMKSFIDGDLITPVEVDDASLYFWPNHLPERHPQVNSFWAVPFNTDVGMLFERSTVDDGQDERTLKTVIDGLADNSHQFVGQFAPTSSASREAYVINVLEYALWHKPSILSEEGHPEQELTVWQQALQPLQIALSHGRIAKTGSEDDSATRFNTAPRPRYMRNWPVAYRTLQRQNDPDVKAGRIRVHPLSHGILGGQSLAVVKKSAHVDRAKDVIRFLTSEEAQKIVAAHGLAPTRTAAYNDEKLRAFIPHLEQIRGAVENGRPRPVLKDYSKFSETVYEHVNRFLSENVALPSSFIDEMREALR